MQDEDDSHDIKVSVCVTTYNHAPFIAECLDSVIAQRTDFPVEIIIGEDDSSDGTREIVKEYARRQSDRIRAFYRAREDVIHINGRPTARRNFLSGLDQARGEYVALIDGDDYWTDELKLQKQVERLDAAPECAICAHKIYDADARGGARPNLKDGHYKIDILLRSNCLPTVSLLFRNHLFSEYPSWFESVVLADWSLNILNARHGSIMYIDEIMAVQRRHAGGTWTGRSHVDQLTDLISTARTFRPILTLAQRRLLDRHVSERRGKLILAVARGQGLWGGLQSLCKSVHECLTTGEDVRALLQSVYNEVRSESRGGR